MSWHLKQYDTTNLSSKDRFSLAEANKTTQEYSVNLVYDLKKANIAIDSKSFSLDKSFNYYLV
jgi:hypothetical protein